MDTNIDLNVNMNLLNIHPDYNLITWKEWYLNILHDYLADPCFGFVTNPQLNWLVENQMWAQVHNQTCGPDDHVTVSTADIGWPGPPAMPEEHEMLDFGHPLNQWRQDVEKKIKMERKAAGDAQWKGCFCM